MVLNGTEAVLVRTAVDLVERRRGNEDHSVVAAVRDTAGNVHTGLNVHHFTGGPRGAGRARPRRHVLRPAAVVTVHFTAVEGT